MTVRRSVLVLILFSLALSACGGGGNKSGVPSGAPSEVSDFSDEWPAPNQDLSNDRVASSSEIDAGNVDQLGVAWTVPIEGGGTFGNYASTPIVADGIAYTQDLTSNVKAIDVQTGQVKWSKDYDAATVGPNGVALGYGRIYGATSDFAFALDKDTGQEIWRSQKLTRNANEGIDMAPGVFNDTVYVSTVPGNTKSFYKGNGQGVLWALDAATGKSKWKFATVPEDLWSAQHTDINSGGGLWHPPAFDDNGDLYIDIANPAPWPGTNELPWGESRPGPNEHSNSMVKLDQDGKLLWATQVLPHDVYDWDLQLPPVLAEDGDRDIALAAGKVGYVYALDRGDGSILWKTPVGKHNGHDRDNETALEGNYQDMPKLPLTIFPGILGGVETQMAYDDGVVYAPIVNLPTTFKTQEEPVLEIPKGTGEMVALNVSDGSVKWKHDFAQPAYGAATISNDLVFTTTFEGKLIALNKNTGEVAWEKQLPAGTNATLAIVGDTLITAASFPQSAGQKPVIIAYRLGAKGTTTTTPTTTTATTTGGSTGANGEAVFTANCGSCHTLNAAGTSGTVGPNLDDLKPNESTVEQQVRNGGGGMPAFEGRLSDAQITAVAQYVAQNAGKGGGGGGGGGGGP